MQSTPDLISKTEPVIIEFSSVGKTDEKENKGMKKGRFNEEQIIGILKEQEAGRKVADLAREHGISEATIYTWKSKYAACTSARRNG